MSTDESDQSAQPAEFLQQQYIANRSEMRDRIKTRSAKFGRGFAFVLAIIGYVFTSNGSNEWILSLIPFGIAIFFFETVRNQRMLIRLGEFNKKLESSLLENAEEFGWEHVGGGRVETAFSGRVILAILGLSYIATGAVGYLTLGEAPNASTVRYIECLYLGILVIGLAPAIAAFFVDVEAQPTFE